MANGNHDSEVLAVTTYAQCLHAGRAPLAASDRCGGSLSVGALSVVPDAFPLPSRVRRAP